MKPTVVGAFLSNVVLIFGFLSFVSGDANNTTVKTPPLVAPNLVWCKEEEYLGAPSSSDRDLMWPTVNIVLLARNKQITLPYFLKTIETLNYPKDRISLWIRTDHNVDDTVDILDKWLDKEGDKFHHVDYRSDDQEEKFSDEASRYDWSSLHYSHLIMLKEKAFQAACDQWADFVWFLDCDVILSNNDTLKRLIDQKKAIIAPMLQSTGAYSNFWCGMTEKLYYKRTPQYLPIVEREITGVFEVPMVHTATLIDLRKTSSRKLTFHPKKLPSYNGPVDDIIVFATSARRFGIPMYVVNSQHFGYVMMPLEKSDTVIDEQEQLTNLKLEAMVEGPPLPVSKHLQSYVHKKSSSSLGFDQIYLINLKRRPERRTRMIKTLNELGLKYKIIDAVDGKGLNSTSIESLGVKMLPEYSDPYHHRPLTMGEVGCFLSHYTIWKDVISNQHRTALVFEDDIRFEPFFRRKLEQLVREANQAQVKWDLIYLGRKRQGESRKEELLPGTTRISHVDYSYWTLGYMISLSGALKLVNAEPLSKMVPVDEYLPIMFDKHPEASWAQHFNNRNLLAFSAHPLLIFPTHYTGEPLYISDTEDSATLSKGFLKGIQIAVPMDVKAVQKDEL